MKKLILSLLTIATAATAVCGFAACSMGKTGGGDTAERNGKNISVQDKQVTETQPDTDDGQATDGEFEFLPPDNMVHGEPTPLPLPPQGRIFAPHIRHPEILQDAPMMGNVKEGAEKSAPKGKMPKKKNVDDMVTPNGAIAPDVRGTGANTDCDGCPEDGQTEQSAPEKAPSRPNKGRKDKRRKPDTKEKKDINEPEEKAE